MKSVCIYSYGGPEVLVYEDSPRPHAGPGEVLVRVYAAGINPVDWKIRAGHLKAMLHHTLPLILGWDVAGVVESIGTDVRRIKVGDEIYSRPDILRDGAYAEFIVIAESEVALKPKSIDCYQAAALPLAGLTAWQTLFDAGGLAAGQRVLIHAAAGGVGSLAVQLAKGKGAHVIGTASARNLDFITSLGVEQAIDYQAVRFEDVVQPVDVVLDLIGGEVQERSWKVIKPGGILVSAVNPPSADTAVKHHVRQAFVFIKPNVGQLAEIAALVDEGKLKPFVEKLLPLFEASEGQKLSEAGHTRGKIILRVV